jgi:hypothetical protein
MVNPPNCYAQLAEADLNRTWARDVDPSNVSVSAAGPLTFRVALTLLPNGVWWNGPGTTEATDG